MLQLCIQSVFTNVLLCAFLIVFIQIDCSFNRKVTGILKATILNALLLMICDCINLYTVEMQLEPFRYITTALGYCLRIFEAYLILLMVLHKKRKKAAFLLVIPVILTIILEFTTIFTKLSFYYDASGQIHRCSLNFIPHVFCGIYMFLIITYSYNDYKRNGEGAFIIIYVALVCVLAVLVEIVFRYHFLLDGSITVGLYVNYLYLHVQIYKRDGLTNLLNRRSFDIFAKQNHDKEFIVVSIDMNNLKVINDTYGHLEGDKAILAVVDSIQSFFKKGNTLYRMGGDEFVLICTKLTQEQILFNFEKVSQKLEEQKYSIAYGIAVHQAYADIQEVCERADGLMYERKKAQKQAFQKSNPFPDKMKVCKIRSRI